MDGDYDYEVMDEDADEEDEDEDEEDDDDLEAALSMDLTPDMLEKLAEALPEESADIFLAGEVRRAGGAHHEAPRANLREHDGPEAWGGCLPSSRPRPSPPLSPARFG